MYSRHLDPIAHQRDGYIVLSFALQRCMHVFDTLVPIRCAMCGTHGAHLCDPCRSNLEALPLVRRSAQSETPSITALGAYVGSLRSAVLNLKFRNRKSAALLLGYTLGKKLRLRVHAAIPVPLHPSRLTLRGFNQAQAIGVGLASALKVPLLCGVLVRVKATRAQSSLALAERRVNVSDAFQVVRSELVPGARVLLVDDVVTTGATLTACARALRGANVSRVIAAALAIKL